MSIRMTAPRLARLIAEGESEPVLQAVRTQPRLLAATVEHEGQGGWTPLHLAVAAGQTALVEQLAAAGADLTARTEHGRTALQVAQERVPDLVAVLRRLGAPVDPATAALLGDVERLAQALDAGAPLTDPATDVPLLSWAATGGSAACAGLLLERGADPDCGALHAAAAAGAAAVVALLLEAGADVDRRDQDTGRTPLHSAVAALDVGPVGDLETVVRLLLDAGADVDATTHDGASALDITRVAGARRRAEGGGGADGGDPDTLGRLLLAAGATH
jgi:ankyrin repeat protein